MSVPFSCFLIQVYATTTQASATTCFQTIIKMLQGIMPWLHWICCKNLHLSPASAVILWDRVSDCTSEVISNSPAVISNYEPLHNLLTSSSSSLTHFLYMTPSSDYHYMLQLPYWVTHCMFLQSFNTSVQQWSGRGPPHIFLLWVCDQWFTWSERSRVGDSPL